MDMFIIIAVLSGGAGLAFVLKKAYVELASISQQSAQLYKQAIDTCNSIVAISRDSVGCYQRATTEMVQAQQLMLKAFQEVMKLTVDINGQMASVADTCLVTSRLAADAEERALDGYNLANTLVAQNTKAYETATERIVASLNVTDTACQTATAALVEGFSGAASACQSAVSSVTSACEKSAQLAAKTCQEVLHSAFPQPELNWSWHHENSFTCYFCQKRFPLTERESIGKYDYCIEHGSVRKERLLKEECGVSQS